MILGSCMVVWNNNRHVKSEFLLDILLTATDYNWFFFFFLRYRSWICGYIRSTIDGGHGFVR